MDYEALISRLKTGLLPNQILLSEPLRSYTTLRLGGPADVLVQAHSTQDVQHALLCARECGVPVTILGNGSNVLVRDGGVRGMVLLIAEGFDDVAAPVQRKDGRYALTAQGGALLTKLSNAAANASLKGLEFAAGIPGTVGGAVFMNAGAYGGEMKDVVAQVTVCEKDGAIRTYSNEEMAFGYRRSAINQQADPGVVTSVTVVLEKGDEDVIRAAMREFNARRREKQPVTLPSCGSTFKRPEGYFAGTLIDQCGLRGYRVGGASVSTLHAGFLLNDQQGTSADYLALMADVKRIVFEKTGVTLEPEVRIIGEETFPSLI